MYVMQNAPFMSLVAAILPGITERKLCLFGAARLPEATWGLILQITKGNI